MKIFINKYLFPVMLMAFCCFFFPTLAKANSKFIIQGNASNHETGAEIALTGTREVTFNVYGGENCRQYFIFADGAWQAFRSNDDDYDENTYPDGDPLESITMDVEFDDFVEYNPFDNTQIIQDLRGNFSVLLEISGSSLKRDYDEDGYPDSLCIGMVIEDDTELVPRMGFGSVPYATFAEELLSQTFTTTPDQVLLYGNPTDNESENAVLMVESDLTTDSTASENARFARKTDKSKTDKNPMLMTLRTKVNDDKGEVTYTDRLTVDSTGLLTTTGGVTLSGTLTLKGSDKTVLLETEAGDILLDHDELSYLDGVTSSLQTQIDTLSSDIDGLSSGTADGGAAATAVSLASNPSDCPSTQFATAIAASGNLGCAALTDADVPNAISISASSVENSVIGASTPAAGTFTNLTANTALKLKETGGGTDTITVQAPANVNNPNSYTLTLPDTDGSSGQYLSTNGSGSLSWADSTATTATALAANPADCSSNQFATSIAASGDLGCAALTDADIPNIITVTTTSQLTVSVDPATTNSIDAALLVNSTGSETDDHFLSLMDTGSEVFGVDKEGDVTFIGNLVATPPSLAQSITGVGVALAPITRIHTFSGTGAHTLTVAPTIPNGTDGQIVTLVNVGPVNAVTIQDQGTLASSNLRLGNTTRVLGPRDNITLLYSTAVGDWVEIGFVDVQ